MIASVQTEVAGVVIGLAVAVAVVVLPRIKKAVGAMVSRVRSVKPDAPVPTPKITPAVKAEWVNELMVLADVADRSSLPDVATAARALLTAMVASKGG